MEMPKALKIIKKQLVRENQKLDLLSIYSYIKFIKVETIKTPHDDNTPAIIH